MPRVIQTAFWEDLESLNAADIEIILIEVTYPGFTVRFVRDVVNYQWRSQLYYAAMFSLEFLSDDDKEPHGTLRVPNVDRVIGESILAITDPPTLRIIVLRGSGFVTSGSLTYMIGGGFGAYGALSYGESDGLTIDAQPLEPVPVDTIVMIGDEDPIIDANFLILKNIRCTAQIVEADIIAWDMSTEPFPGHRASKARFPGLYV